MVKLNFLLNYVQFILFMSEKSNIFAVDLLI
jgi:hypothetical protein